MGHFGVTKTLDILKELFYWPHLQRNVSKFCEQYDIFQVKSKVLPHGLYTPLLIPTRYFNGFCILFAKVKE